jgi:hypothetical protein
MDTSTSFLQAQAMPIGDLLSFWDCLVEVTKERNDQAEQMINDTRGGK